MQDKNNIGQSGAPTKSNNDKDLERHILLADLVAKYGEDKYFYIDYQHPNITKFYQAVDKKNTDTIKYLGGVPMDSIGHWANYEQAVEHYAVKTDNKVYGNYYNEKEAIKQAKEIVKYQPHKADVYQQTVIQVWRGGIYEIENEKDIKVTKSFRGKQETKAPVFSM